MLGQAKRSPGSMLKPFTYALALDQGLIHEKTVLIDSPIAIGGWAPDNADGSFRGPLSRRRCIGASRAIFRRSIWKSASVRAL